MSPKVNNNFTKDNNQIIEESILVALVSISAYILTYSYECGYSSFFNIPQYLIEVNLTSIFIVGGSLIAVYFAILGIYEIFSMIIPTMPSYLNKAFVYFIPILSVFIGSIFSYGTFQRDQITLLVVILMLIVLTLCLPLITQRKTKGYFNKLREQDKYETKLDSNHTSIIKRMVSNVPKELLFLFFYLIIGVMIAYNHGNASAMKQIGFVVLKTQPETVVLRKYGDNFITTNLDRKNKSVTIEFSIVNDANNVTKLELEKVGPLKVR